MRGFEDSAEELSKHRNPVLPMSRPWAIMESTQWSTPCWLSCLMCKCQCTKLIIIIRAFHIRLWTIRKFQKRIDFKAVIFNELKVTCQFVYHQRAENRGWMEYSSIHNNHQYNNNWISKRKLHSGLAHKSGGVHHVGNLKSGEFRELEATTTGYFAA